MATTDEGIFIDQDYRMATVVDRTGLGGPIKLSDGRLLPGEVQYDHIVHLITKKPFLLRGPVVKHAFGPGSKSWLHDKDGNYVNRLGVQDAPEDLLAELGPEAQDCSPIEVDLDAVEHWNYGVVDPTRQETIRARTRRVKVPGNAQLDKAGVGGRVTAEKG